PGAAITSIKIDGVQHEFSTIKGVVEDLSAIILNLKQVKIRLNDSKHEKVSLHLEGPGEIKAEVLQNGQAEFELMNPEQHLLTLNDNADFNMEVMIGRGR
ncbi:DNA-directed RNA polymerase subunit alpha, partial [candidate division KSB1 bacterium]|nr:DNA-directed RNA polymerase subunit alpha [Phycisphaerae bacterium]NIV95097.1 DNA-directed RNA polymerase subunit alpha [candidate division KSB1 bacterium]NIX30976.1 DNA-directed RNA polymerase subunit alpha [Phycisphaerae bacterium]